MSGNRSRPEHVDCMYQAQATVGTQAGCTFEDALTLMQVTAAATDETLEEVAKLVLTGEIWFDVD